MITELCRVLQLADSTLPVGAFSFSNGLESAVQHRIVHDLATLRQFVRTATMQAASGDGIALLVTHRCLVQDDEPGMMSADHAILNRKLNEEQRTMTLRMGRKLVQLAERVFCSPGVIRWHALIRDGRTPGTYPASLAVALATKGVGEREAFAVHQYGVATMMLSASLRLMKLDYVDVQALLYEVNAEVENDYARASAGTLDDMATFAPVSDILAACHLRAHVRLFMS